MTALALLFGAFLAALLLGAPVALAMALAVGLYAVAFAPALPDIVLIQTFMQGLDNTAFTAIPYFFLAGAIMNLGGMSARLMRLARAALSHLRGGLSHANIGASVVFAGVSGSAVADAAAVGSVMIPAMRREGYPGAYAAAVTAASATIGLVIPPSIPMVIFGLFTGADVGALFLGGVLPGLAMGAFLIAASMVLSIRRGYPRTPWQGWGEFGAALRGASLALAMPVLVVGGLTMGVATTSEIGAVAALYAALVSWAVYREATLRDLWRACVGAAVDSARVLIIVAVSGGFVWIIASLGVARDMAAAIEGDRAARPGAPLADRGGAARARHGARADHAPRRRGAAHGARGARGRDRPRPPRRRLDPGLGHRARHAARGHPALRHRRAGGGARARRDRRGRAVPRGAGRAPRPRRARSGLDDVAPLADALSMPPRRDPRIDQTLTFRILVAANRLSQPFHERFGRALDLGLPDWRCLMALAAAPDSSGEAVARRMAMDKMAVSRSLRKLDAAGRVTAQADPNHARRRRWRLTEAGWAVVDAVMPEAMARDEAAFGDLSHDDRAAMLRVLDALAEPGPRGPSDAG